jgi:hypothetical protein
MLLVAAKKYQALVHHKDIAAGERDQSGDTDDFNPSIAVGISPAGPIVYLSWVFTDADAGQGVSLTVNQLQAGQSITTLSGSDLLYFIGSDSDSSNALYGEYSSASIDAGISNGNCAISAQEYFGTDSTWRTRVARLGNC